MKGYGVGMVLVSPNGDHIPLTVKLNYNSTNNTAEYEACILGMKAALEVKVQKLDVFGDLNLIVSQVRGNWKVKEGKLKPYHEHLEGLRKKFEKVTFFYLPKEENQLADSLATLTSMIQIPVCVKMMPLVIEQRCEPYFCMVTTIKDEEGEKFGTS